MNLQENKPTVSIILTTYNCGDTLLDILNTIEMQDYPNIEVNIKDGQSTDQTMDIIKSYKDSSKYSVHYESKKDAGIYDAMNQGYQLSTGDIVVFSSDKLSKKEAVSHMVQTIIEAGETCVGAHADLIYSDNGRPVRVWKMGKGHIRTGWMPGHPTLYLKRWIYEKYGLYKTDYRIAGDYEFMLRICKEHEDDIAYLPEMIVDMSYGGTSTATLGSYFENLGETNRALRENGYKFPYFISFMRMIRLPIQFLKGKRTSV